MKIVNYIFFIISIIGIIFAIYLIIEGNQPCSSDSCMIHILYMIGAVILLISALLFRVTYMNIRKFSKSRQQ